MAWPYRLTENSKVFLSVDPFSCTRSKVPPKGRTEIRSSMVMEPTDTLTMFRHTGQQKGEDADLLQIGVCQRSAPPPPVILQPLTVSAAFINRCADAPSVQDGGADVVPLDAVCRSDVVVDLNHVDRKASVTGWLYLAQRSEETAAEHQKCSVSRCFTALDFKSRGLPVKMHQDHTWLTLSGLSVLRSDHDKCF